MAATAELTALHPGLAPRVDPFAPLALTMWRMADAVRAVAGDMIDPADPGRRGVSLPMADAATVLWTRYLRFDAADPRWPDRDRFVPSAASSPTLLPVLLHLAGVEGMGLADLRGASCLPLDAGHPDIAQHPAMEMAAAPSGQGLAGAIGMALAERMLAARFGRSLVDHRTWVVAAAGDLMEGVSHEAIALAGHLRLDKLTVLYEDAGADGGQPCSTDQLRRFASHGWAVKQADAGDPMQIAGAMSFAVRSKKPTLIACRADGREQGASLLRRSSSSRDDGPLPIAEDIADRWHAAGRRGAGARRAWLKRLARHPLRSEFERVMAGRLPDTWHEGLAALKAELAEERPVLATAQASQRVIEALAPALPELVAASSAAGLDHGMAQTLGQVGPGSFSGRYVDFGAREHGMAAAFNGLAAHGGLIPHAAALLGASDQMHPALRLGALMGQRVIHLLTHDPAGFGESGPAQLPVEHLASLRATPGVLVFRPADAVETAECWELALRRSDGPSLIILTGQALPVLRSEAAENRCARGGYVLAEAGGARQATLIATGSEVGVAMAARALLAAEGIAAAVVSLPCWELFAEQDRAVRAQVLGGVPRIAIEAGSRFGWDRWLGEDGLFIGMGGLGASASGRRPERHSGITAGAVAASVQKRLGDIVPERPQRSEGSRE